MQNGSRFGGGSGYSVLESSNDEKDDRVDVKIHDENLMIMQSMPLGDQRQVACSS